ncbi:hypothetical protein [Kordia sp.]|uniref:hypothetical protein n=1 Tax=Kordia sp. TaxID=1965332 RepID=UPI003D271909
MKLIITLFSLVAFSTSLTMSNSEEAKNDNNINTYKVVFDGSEGGMCFFTNSNNQAITIEDEENKLFEKYGKDDNSFVGKTFTMQLKATNTTDHVYTIKSVIEFKIDETSKN